MLSQTADIAAAGNFILVFHQRPGGDLNPPCPPPPSSFTFSHSSRGTYAHLFHPFSFSRSHTFVLYMLTQVRSWLGKQQMEMKRKSLGWGGGRWGRSERLEMTGRSQPRLQFGIVWPLIRKYLKQTFICF